MTKRRSGLVDRRDGIAMHGSRRADVVEERIVAAVAAAADDDDEETS